MKVSGRESWRSLPQDWLGAGDLSPSPIRSLKHMDLTEEAAPQAGLPPLEPLEVHSGMVFGLRRTPPPPPDATTKATAVRDVLEELLVPALSRTPCLVAFSGGRDSSAMLAMAVHVARRHGLEHPVPITFRIDQ